MSIEDVSIDRLPDWVTIRVKSIAPNTLKACVAAAHRGRNIIRETIDQTKPFPPVDRGMFRASFKVEKQPDGALLFSDAPHAAFIEYGCRPHWAPFKPLLDWVKRKKIADPGDEWIVAKGVQKAIARRGMAPRKIVERSIPRIMKALDEELVRQVVGEMGKK